MPTIQQKVLVEKRMNMHWDQLATKGHVVDTHWDVKKSIGITRREHHILNDKKIETENLKLYKKLCRINGGVEPTKIAQYIASTGHAGAQKQLFEHREWQRHHNREERQSKIDRENLKLYNTLNKTLSRVGSAEDMAREYHENHKIVNTCTMNKVKEHELHLNIQRYNQKTCSHSPSRQRLTFKATEHSPLSPQISPIKNNSSKKRIDNSVLQKSAPSSDCITKSTMPSRFRQLVRPKSASDISRNKGRPSRKSTASRPKSNKSMKDEVRLFYKRLSQRAASTLTSEEIETYVSDHQYENSSESEVYQYVCGDILNREDDVTYSQNDYDHVDDGNRKVAKVLFSGNLTGKTSPSREEVKENVRHFDDICSPLRTNNTVSERFDKTEESFSPSMEKCMSRRQLFTETRLEARIKMHTQSDSDNENESNIPLNPFFVVRMYDVGESCDLRQLSPVKNATTYISAHSEGTPEKDKYVNVAEAPSPTSPLVALNGNNTGTSRPISVATSSGILIECRLQPESENTRSHELFISIPDIKSMIKRTFAKKSKLWQAIKSVSCRHKERALFDCLSDHLTASLQDQLCGLLAKNIELLVSIDQKSHEGQEFEDRINVKFHFQL